MYSTHEMSSSSLSRGPITLSTIAALTLASLCLVTAAMAGEQDPYRYALETSVDGKVCSHMQTVYNTYFRYPWKRPFLTKLTDDPEYGADSPYAFPKLPGVAHDSSAALLMSFSRRPSSPEFDAIAWREGRIDYGQPAGEGPALVAVFDVDNDGTQELVIKSAFARTYESDGGRGGWDYVYIFKDRRIQELPNPIPLGAFRPKGLTGPALIVQSPGFPYRFVRPFRLKGVTYIAAYDQSYRGKTVSEFVDILKYLGGGYLVKVGERSQVKVSRVCRLRMESERGAK